MRASSCNHRTTAFSNSYSLLITRSDLFRMETRFSLSISIQSRDWTTTSMLSTERWKEMWSEGKKCNAKTATNEKKLWHLIVRPANRVGSLTKHWPIHQWRLLWSMMSLAKSYNKLIYIGKLHLVVAICSKNFSQYWCYWQYKVLNYKKTMHGVKIFSFSPIYL